MSFDYLKESASRDPVGRLLATLNKLGPDKSRMALAAKEVDLSEQEFLSAIAEAEWGGLVKREERSGGYYLVLTPQGQARVDAITRPTSSSSPLL